MVARTPLMRLRGLAGRQPDNTVLIIHRCNDVHTLTMRHALDIAFVDKRGRVVEVRRMVLPGVRLRNRTASAVIERFAGTGPWFTVGATLSIKGEPTPVRSLVAPSRKARRPPQRRREGKTAWLSRSGKR